MNRRLRMLGFVWVSAIALGAGCGESDEATASGASAATPQATAGKEAEPAKTAAGGGVAATFELGEDGTHSFAIGAAFAMKETWSNTSGEKGQSIRLELYDRGVTATCDSGVDDTELSAGKIAMVVAARTAAFPSGPGSFDVSYRAIRGPDREWVDEGRATLVIEKIDGGSVTARLSSDEGRLRVADSITATLCRD
jgi:hypothetical protein